jgi:hypothetical protein
VLKTVFSEVDIVLVPTLPVLPPARDAETITVGGRQLDFTLALIRYTFVFDHTGNPVVSLPVTETAPGIGSSVQVVADKNRDISSSTLGSSSIARYKNLTRSYMRSDRDGDPREPRRTRYSISCPAMGFTTFI